MHALNAKKLKEESWMLMQIRVFATKSDSILLQTNCNAESAIQPARNAQATGSPKAVFLTNGEAQVIQSVYRGPEQVKHPSKQGLQSSPSTVLYILVSSHGVKQDPLVSIPGGYLIFSLAISINWMCRLAPHIRLAF